MLQDAHDTSAADASERLTGWLCASAAGDAAAFRRLHRATHQRLLRVALEVLPQHERAEEALQEAYLKAWRHAGSFDPRATCGMSPVVRPPSCTARSTSRGSCPGSR